MTEANTVYIGNKPPIAYVTALLSAFEGENNEVAIMARGRAISRAVDVAEIARSRYLKDVELGNIVIGTEQLPTEDGRTRGVSTISITLKRMGKASTEPEAAEEGSTDLSEIKGVGKATADKLLKAGYATAEAVASAEAVKMAEEAGISEKVAQKLIGAAKEIL